MKVSVVGPPYGSWSATGLRNPDRRRAGASRYVLPATAVDRRDGRAVFAARAPEKLEKPMAMAAAGSDGFAGLEDNYFLAVLLPDAGAERGRLLPSRRGHGGQAGARSVGGGAHRQRRASRPRRTSGPKDVEILESLNLGLEKTVDFGWYGILARPLLWLLKRTYGSVGQLGLAILLVTLCDPHPALPADAQELLVDEEDAEARAEDERDPGQVQEGQERRGAARRR